MKKMSIFDIVSLYIVIILAAWIVISLFDIMANQLNGGPRIEWNFFSVLIRIGSDIAK